MGPPIGRMTGISREALPWGLRKARMHPPPTQGMDAGLIDEPRPVRKTNEDDFWASRHHDDLDSPAPTRECLEEVWRLSLIWIAFCVAAASSPSKTT